MHICQILFCCCRFSDSDSHHTFCVLCDTLTASFYHSCYTRSVIPNKRNGMNSLLIIYYSTFGWTHGHTHVVRHISLKFIYLLHRLHERSFTSVACEHVSTSDTSTQMIMISNVISTVSHCPIAHHTVHSQLMLSVSQ